MAFFELKSTKRLNYVYMDYVINREMVAESNNQHLKFI